MLINVADLTGFDFFEVGWNIHLDLTLGFFDKVVS